MLVQNAKIWKDGEEEVVDLRLEEGIFQEIALGLEPKVDEEVLDAKGRTLLPGIIDLHCHMRDPGLTSKEDALSGSRAAARGGVMTFFDMPNTNPATLSLEALRLKQEAYQGKSYVDYAFYAGGAAYNNAEEVAKMQESCTGTKVFMNQSTGNLLVEEEKALEDIFRASKRVAVHAEGEMVRKAIELARRCEKPLYLCHISSKEELEYIQKAKEEGLEIYAEVTPHHLFFTKEDWEKNPLLCMKPSLKTKEDQKALWEALASGLLDTLGTDHAPHLLSEKEAKTLYGIPGVEHSLELLWKAVKEGCLSQGRLQEVMAENPAKIAGLKKKGKIALGYAADLVILEEDESPIRREEVVSKAGWSPYEGIERGAKVYASILAGELVYMDGEFTKEAKGRELR